MKKYYLMAIEKGNSVAMNSLGNYYKEQNDYDNMKKYYLMAIEKKNTSAMYNLAIYYKNLKDSDNMKKYYLMAIPLLDIEGKNKIRNELLNWKKYIIDNIKTIVKPEHIDINKSFYDIDTDSYKKYIIDTFMKDFNFIFNEVETISIIIQFCPFNIVNVYGLNIFNKSDKNTLLSFKSLNKFANYNNISTKQAEIIFDEYFKNYIFI